MSKNLQVQGITKAMLRESIQHNTYWNGALAPMPMSKALWMLANPRIEETDFCAVLTTENDQILSFISMLPDYLNLKNTQFKKVYWMVLWWASPQSKNTVVATYTFHEALKLTNHQILIKSYAEHVDAFYRKMPFVVIAARNRHTIFLSLDPTMLVGRFKFLRKIRFILDILDRAVAFVINTINRRKLKITTAPLQYDYMNELDDNNQEVAVGVTGELCLGGPQITPGYWNDEERNEKRFFFRNEMGINVRYYKTGDLCIKDKDGDFLYVGRADFQVKIRGYRVELAEIEFHTKAKSKEKVNMVALDIYNNLGNTEIALAIESDPFDTREIFEHMKSQMPNYMVPMHLKFIKEFPHSLNGKIDRKKLKQYFETT